MSSAKLSSKKMVKPFCKVCFDSGKEESVYRSHYVRSNPGTQSKVICPTLLSQECTYCHTLGHSLKYCNILLSKNKKVVREQKKNEYKDPPKDLVKKTSKKSSNKYADLEDNNSDVETEKKDEFPELCKPVQKQVNRNIVSYADMASKPKIVEEKFTEYDMMDDIDSIEVVPSPPKYPGKLKSTCKSWADWESSDSEPEEDEDCPDEYNYGDVEEDW